MSGGNERRFSVPAIDYLNRLANRHSSDSGFGLFFVSRQEQFSAVEFEKLGVIADPEGKFEIRGSKCELKFRG